MNTKPDDQNHRILVIDDNRSIHDDFRKILSASTGGTATMEAAEVALFGASTETVRPPSFEVDSAYQGQEGVLLVQKALAAGRPYAMAFVDVRMPPGWDGVETAQRIWELDPNLQIVLCTAYSDYSWDQMFAKLGHHDGLLILKKPFDAVEALQLAHALTEKWRLHQQARQKLEVLEGMVAERTRELQVANGALQAEVEEHRRAEESLHESHARLEFALGAAQIGEWDWDLANGTSRRSLRHDLAFGYQEPVPDWDYAKFLQHVHPEDRDLLDRRFKQALAELRDTGFECRVLWPDGSTHWIEVHGRIYITADGRATRMLGIISDITGRKRGQEVLRESEERFSGAFEHAPIGLALVSPDGRWLKVNRALCDLLGYNEADLLTRTFQDITYPADLNADLEQVQRLLAGEIQFYQMEKRYVHRGGHLVTVSLSVSLVRGNEGGARYFISQIQDITERKRVENALLETSALLETLLQNASDGIYFKDLQSRFVHFSREMLKSFRLSQSDELKGKTDFDFFFEEHAAPAFEAEQEMIRTGKPVFNLEEKEVHRDGRVNWVSSSKTPWRDHAGNIIGIMGISRDITARKRIEEDLRESEERFSGAFEHAPIGLALVAPDGRWLKVNRALCELLGYTEAEMLARTFLDITHPDDLNLHLEPMRQLFAGEIRFYHFEKRYLHRSGRPISVALSVSLVRDAHGGPRYIISQVQDITERNRTEESLRLLGSAVRQSRESILITDAELDLPGPKIIFANPAFTRMTGYTAEEAIGQTPRMLQGPRTDRTVLQRLRQKLERGEAFEGETVNYRRDGEAFVLEWQIAPIRNAGGKVTHYVAVQHDITARKRAEDLVRESQERYRSLIDNAQDAIFTIAPDGTFTSLNPAVEAMAEISRADWLGKPFAPMVHPDDLPLAQEMFQRILRGEPAPVHELRGHPDLRRPARLEMTLTAQKDGDGKIIGVLGIGRDITDRRRLEEQLFQSQKLETVGRLAGGIAHEFNSILTAIIGQSELLLADLPIWSPLAKNATEINLAASRAATLTRQLLAYGRKQVLQAESLDLNRVIAGMEGVFHHLMGASVDTQIITTPGLALVRADAGQIEQVIMNLAINARDAMPNGGKFILETANVTFDRDTVGRYPELKPGGYVLLAITDTGTGMSPEVKARVFEPFFSTKKVGQGTGLGLSTCYGIIKQSGGHISVYSEPSRGATFKVYLPQFEAEATPPLRRLNSPNLPRGTETILLVEDDPALREMAVTLLRRLGYTVLSAANGIEALSLKQQRDVGHIDLLFTDVVMPHMSGKELADRMQALHPHTRILFTSAYTKNAAIHQGMLNQGVALLSKPFTPAALANKLREVLDRPAAAQPDPASPLGMG